MLELHENATHLVLRGPPSELDTIGNDLKFQSDGHHFALSYQRYKVTHGAEGWDGYSKPLLRIGATVGKILRGYKEDILQLAKFNRISLDTRALLEYPFADLELEDVRPDLIAGEFELDTDQRQCICDWLRAGIGFNKMTVGSGKTATFGGAAALIKERFPDARFLYITPSERLVRQSTHELRKFLPHFDIGQCGGGKKEFEAKDMSVCTIAMLNHHFLALRTKGFFDVLALLYDECHHGTSDSSKRILMATPAYFRLGASDTSKKDDIGKFNTLKGLFGPMLNEIKAAPLMKSGRLAKPHIYIVDKPEWQNKFSAVPFRPCIGTPAYILLEGEWRKGTYAGPVYDLDDKGDMKMRDVKTADQDGDGNWISRQEPVTVTGLHKIDFDGVEHEVESRWCLLERMSDRAIIGFKPRTDIILRWAAYFHKKGWQSVVVATRTTYVYILEALLIGELGADAVRVLTGEDSSKVRDEAFEWLKNTPGGILVTPIVKEGVSLNFLRGMIVADAVANAEVARQIIGRAIRQKAEDNRAHIVFFWDRQHRVLSKSCQVVFQQLEKVDGFTFYHPCTGPESVFPEDFRSERNERKQNRTPVQS